MLQDSYEKSNLRNRSFKGQNLSGLNFQGADIRGANFSNAILIGANFSKVHTGLSPLPSIGLVMSSLIMVALGSLVVGYSSAFPVFIINLLAEKDVVGEEILITVGLLFLASFIFIIVKQGLGSSLGILSTAIAILTAVVAFTGIGDSSITAASVIQSVIIIINISGVLLISLALNIFISISKAKTLVFPIIIALIAIRVGLQEGVKGTSNSIISIPIISSFIVSIILIYLSIFISIKAKYKDSRYKLIQSISISLCTFLGTNFRGSDLTDTNFSQAKIPYADFRKTTLTRVSWFQSIQLDLSRVEGTYLEDSHLQNLVVSRNGQKGVYDYKNLQRLNLRSANLVDASFVGSDLTETNLENADLTRAKLVKTRLYGANLTNSCLTGICIQDWAISTDTSLEKIRCEYVYMRLPTQEDPDPWRKPDNRNEIFKEGDFTDFITPIIKTLDLYSQQNVDPRRMVNTFKSLDLYHYGGIDPAAVAIALQQLAEENPEIGLEVVALEGRGKEKIRLQTVVSGEANNSQLNVKYFEKYDEISSLPYSSIQALLAVAAEKDERICSLERLIKDTLQQPRFYVETYQNQGEIVMSQNKGNVHISAVQGDVSGIAAAGENQTMTGVALGAISGSVSNTINQLPASSDPDNQGIKELLSQLQAAIETESELSDEDKAEALEQVKTLAEAGQKPEDNILKKAAKTSMKILKGTIVNLPDTAKLVESCAKLLPAITTLLALS